MRVTQEVAKGAERVLTLSRGALVAAPWQRRGADAAPASLAAMLLPLNYETSVRSGYTAYAKYTMASSAMGTAASVISIQAMLVAIGVASSPGALPMAATLNWIIKDGLGQLGGVVFASMVNTRFDADPKRFRWAADWALGIAVVMEAATGLFPWAFLPVAAVANIGKNMAWISASATRASIHQSFTKEKNLADVTAKAASQTVAASVAGTMLGVGITPLLHSSASLQVAAAALLSCGHVYFSYKGLQAVVLATLNPQRAAKALAPAVSANTMDWTRIASPAQVASQESFAPDKTVKSIKYGTSLESFSAEEVLTSLSRSRRHRDGHLLIERDGLVHVLLFVSTEPDQVILGFFHAWLVANKFPGRIDDARQWMLRNNVDGLLVGQLRESGWDCRHLFLELKRARVRFEDTDYAEWNDIYRDNNNDD